MVHKTRNVSWYCVSLYDSNCANSQQFSSFRYLFFNFKNLYPLGFGEFKLKLSVFHWINDALMAIFLVVGLEIKREFVEGELSRPKQAALPILGAVGGMLVPALVYVAFNYETPETLRGWAIPSATDIAFSIGILSLLGSKSPTVIKSFLVALAIIDDMGAVIIIAIFYSTKLNIFYLTLVLVAF